MTKNKTYNEFLEKMKVDGHTRKNLILDGTEPIFNKYIVKKDTIGKFLGIICPINSVITHCGNRIACDKNYQFSIKCCNDELNEPFSNPLRSSVLVAKKTKKLPGIIVGNQMVVTKIGNKPNNIKDLDLEWQEQIKFVLNAINSTNPNEYPLWSGIYKEINFRQGFYLESGEKLIFYAISPDLDIKSIDLKLEVDMFEKV